MFPLLKKKVAKNKKSIKKDTLTKGDNTDIKTTGKFQGKSNAPGGGGRFSQMVASGKSLALAAYIGRKKYGKKLMAKFAAKGK